MLASIGASATSKPTDTRSSSKANDGARVAIDVVRALDREGLEPASLALREPTLDDVFLTLTGHGAEERATDEEADTGRKRTRGAA